MEQVPRKRGKTDKNSESKQERDDEEPSHCARKVGRWGRATLAWWGHAI